MGSEPGGTAAWSGERGAWSAPIAAPPRSTLHAPVSPATVRDLLGALDARLTAAGAADPRTTARDLVAALLDRPRLWAVTNAGAPVDAELWQQAERAASRIVAGEPFAYAVGRASFRHLTLRVDGRVLIPRPETELLVDEVLARVAPGGTAVDVGTGSGAIALSLATEGAFDRVIATDVSLDALAVARDNAAAHADALRAAVEFRHGSLLAPLGGQRVRVVVANPPYIAHEEADELPAAVRDWEPAVALFSADDGMAATTALVCQAAAALEPGGLLALEVDSRRARRVAEVAASCAGYLEIEVRADLTGRERFVIARRG